MTTPSALSSDACVIVAAQRYGVAADLLLAVRSVERGAPHRATRNNDGTRDYNEPGLNSRTMNALVGLGWDPFLLEHDGCYAMKASAYWMSIKLLEVSNTSMPLLARAARYNSATPSYNVRYQGLLRESLRNWSCYLHRHWKLPSAALFAVASKVITENELNTCLPKTNPY